SFLSFLVGEGLFATEQVENDDDCHHSDDAVAAQRGHQLQHVTDDVAEEGDVAAEQHLQHDAEGNEQEAQLRDLGDPGFGPVEQFHQLFLRLTPGTGELPAILVLPLRGTRKRERTKLRTTRAPRPDTTERRNSQQAIVIKTPMWRNLLWGWT